MPTREEIIEAIKQVYDPEIPVNVYDLGLIYEIQIADEGDVQIKMSLTAQGCPAAQEIPVMIKNRVELLPNVRKTEVQVVWEPAWKPSMISAEGKKILKLEDET